MAKIKERKNRIGRAIKELQEEKIEVLSNKQIVITMVDIDEIKELTLQDSSIAMHNRISYSKDKLIDLADNIKELSAMGGGILGTGVIHPIMLRKVGLKLERIHGDNRIKALVLNNATKVPAIILENVSDELARFLRSSENLNREDLNVYDETLSILEHIQLACGFNDIDSVKSFIHKVKNYRNGKTTLDENDKLLYREVSSVFEKIGRFDIITFVDRLSVLKMNDLIKQAIVDEYIGYTQATVINSKVKNSNEIIKLLSLLKNKKMTVSELKKYIIRLLDSTKISDEKKKKTPYEQIESTSKIISKTLYNKLNVDKKVKIDEILNKIIESQTEIKKIIKKESI